MHPSPHLRTRNYLVLANRSLDGVAGPTLDEPRTASGSSRSESENPVVAVAQVNSERAPNATVERAETTEAKPVRGVVLEFATRMRQSRGREVALND
jgi:hypothetical protein